MNWSQGRAGCTWTACTWAWAAMTPGRHLCACPSLRTCVQRASDTVTLDSTNLPAATVLRVSAFGAPHCLSCAITGALVVRVHVRTCLYDFQHIDLCLQVHEPYLIGPGRYSFGMLLCAQGTDVSMNDAVTRAGKLRAGWLSSLKQ